MVVWNVRKDPENLILVATMHLFLVIQLFTHDIIVKVTIEEIAVAVVENHNNDLSTAKGYLW